MRSPDLLAGGRATSAVAVVDDHRLFSSAVTLALRARGFVAVELPLSTLAAVETQLAAAPPSVLLLDLELGAVGRGDDLVAPATALGTAVLVVSALRDEVRIGRCLALGAAGWLSKDSPLEELVAAVGTVAAGEPVMAPSERERLIESWRQHPSASAEARLARLTRREASVLGMLMEGRGVEEIAADAFVSEATVRTQVKAILVKLNVHSQLQAVVTASRANWRPPMAAQS